MAGKVLPSIEPVSGPASPLPDGSVLSDNTNDTYVEEGTPEPDDPEARLDWGRKHNGEGWYREALADREAARNARREEEERERIEGEEAEARSRLRKTDPWGYARQMREHNLRLQGVSQEQIDAANRPLTAEEIERNWSGFSTLLSGGDLQPATADERADARSESIEVSQSRVSLRPQKPMDEVPRKIRRGRITKSTARNRSVGSGSRSKRAAPTLAEALADEERTPNGVPPSKHHKRRQRKAYKKERASRRLAHEPPEFDLLAEPSVAPPLHEPLPRNPSTRMRNSARPRSHASPKSIAVEAAKPQGISKSGREGTHRSRSKKQSGG